MKESNQRWCSDGFEFCCDNGERLRVTFALDCCDREALHWAVTTGGFNSETVQDVMLGAVERRFGNDLPSSPVEWLTDNGSCYRANETRQFARMLGLEPKNTAVRSPESNGIAESFVKTVSAPSATSCENCPVWQQSRPSILMDTNDEFPDNKRYSLLPFLFA